VLGLYMLGDSVYKVGNLGVIGVKVIRGYNNLGLQVYMD
jgi:hypothetical protein